MQSTFRNIVTDELKRVLGSSTNAVTSSDKDLASEEQDADMLWNYETMTARAPSELAKEDYVDLMVAMERALYDDLLAEMRAQGTTVIFSCSTTSFTRHTKMFWNVGILKELLDDSNIGNQLYVHEHRNALGLTEACFKS